jgi:uncharacterized repeat protein (TIGR01451 family)
VVVHQITIVNEGMAVASDIFLSDTLPENTACVTAVGGTVIQGGPTQVIMHWDNLAPFGQLSTTVTIRVNDDAPLGAVGENYARVTTEYPESNDDNNEVTVPDIIGGPAASPGPRQ